MQAVARNKTRHMGTQGCRWGGPGAVLPMLGVLLLVLALLSGCRTAVPLSPLPVDVQTVKDAELLSEQRARIMQDLQIQVVREADKRKAELIAASAKTQAAITLGVDDEFTIDVWLQDGITQMTAFPFKGVVQPNGTEFVPGAGEVPCLGKTPTEIRDEVRKRLSAVLNNPIVNLRVTRHVAATVSIVGEVMMHSNRDSGPGVYPIKGATSLSDFIMAAGGYTKEADIRRVRVVYHDGTAETVDLEKILAGDMARNVLLRGGETVYVPELKRTGSVLIMGHVRNPGAYGLESDRHLSVVMAAAGGVGPTGSSKRVVLIRGDMYKPQVMHVNLDRILKYGFKEEDVLLNNGDTIYVPMNYVSSFREFLSLIALPVSTAWQFFSLQDLTNNNSNNNR